MNANEESLFAQALEILDLHERAAFLDRACGGAAALRQSVESLLSAYAAGGFLESPAVIATTDESAGRQVALAVNEAAGTVVGPYRLLEQIGEGGMGVVFMAQQHEPIRRRVAVKVLKPGMDSAQVIARFEAERQALALMDHPNIARVLDAGTTAGEPGCVSGGRPFFVMELIRGVPITDCCDQSRLTTRERLELFVSVCSAVQHAHQKGIIHRDVKPSNVLVTSHDGVLVVKVIDFGVAKALGQPLTDRTLFTGFAQMIGTPLYMSPEQAGMSGLDVDTRSDIYSLGVLLYELLTGSTPFDKERLKEASYDEIRRIIREEEPPRPSTRISTLGQAANTLSGRSKSEPRRLSQLLRGELDWIVMKALEKDRNRRYETASAFAADVQRYLHDEPVQACPPSAWYRIRKFSRRHKGRLAIVGLSLFFLVILGGGVGWVARDQVMRREVQEREAETALQAAVEALDRKNWQEATAWARRARVVLAGGQEHPVLSGRLDDILADLKMVDRLAEIRILRSRVRDERFDELSADPEFVQVFREYGIDVEALGVEDAATAIRDKRIWLELVVALDEWHYLRRTMKPHDKSWKYLLAVAQAVDTDEVRNQIRRAVETLPVDLPALARLATSDRLTALSAQTLEFFAVCLAQSGEVEKAVAVLRHAQRRFPNDFWINHDLGYYLMDTKRWQEALPHFTAALALRPESPGVCINLSVVLQKMGDYAWAVAVCDEAIRLKPDYATAWNNRGASYSKLGRHDKARADYSRAIALNMPGGTVYFHRGLAYVELHQLDRAKADFARAIELMPDDARHWVNRGLAYNQLLQNEKAVAEFSKAIGLKPNEAELWWALGLSHSNLKQHEKALAAFSMAIDLKENYAEAWSGRGLAYSNLDQYEKALAALSKAIDLKADLAVAWSRRGEVRAKQHQYEKAITDYSKAIDLDPNSAGARCGRGMAYAHRGDPARALDDFNRALELNPDYPEALNGRVIVRGELRLPVNALAELSRAIKLKPDYPEALNNRGTVYHEMRDYARAIADYTEAIKLKPKYAEVWSNRGNTYLEMEQYRKALADYSQAIELKPALAGFWYNRGRTYHKLRLHARAIANYSEAIKLKPDFVDAWNDRGNVYKNLDQPERAVAEYSTAIQLKHDFWQAYDNRGRMYVGLDRPQDALKDLQKVLELTPESARAHNNLAWLLATCSDAKLRDPKKAVQLAKKAVELATRDGSNWNTLGVALYRARDCKAALTALEKSVQLRNGGTGSDWLFLAMIHWKLDCKDRSRPAYDRAVLWMKKYAPQDKELQRFRAEAEKLLGVKDEKE